MKRLLNAIVTTVWALWFGGLLALFIMVSSLFETFAADHETAGRAASAIFRRFDKIQLVLGAIGLIGTCIWRAIHPRGVVTLLFCLLALAVMADCWIAIRITPQLERMRIDHLTHTAQFAKLHGRSMILYLAEMTFLFAAGIVLTIWSGACSPRILLFALRRHAIDSRRFEERNKIVGGKFLRPSRTVQPCSSQRLNAVVPRLSQGFSERLAPV